MSSKATEVPVTPLPKIPMAPAACATRTVVGVRVGAHGQVQHVYGDSALSGTESSGFASSSTPRGQSTPRGGRQSLRVSTPTTAPLTPRSANRIMFAGASPSPPPEPEQQ